MKETERKAVFRTCLETRTPEPSVAGLLNAAASTKVLNTKPFEQIAVKMFGSCSDFSRAL